MLRMTPLASAIVALLLGIEAYAAEETFDTHFMIGGMKDQQVANIRLDDNQPLPGQYDIDIYVNKQWRGKYEIIVKDNPQETCLSREVIKRLGINSDNFASGKQCLTFEQLVQGGSYTWDIGVFRLDFSVPQAWVEELESGYVPPENWERGINAFYTSYYLSQYYSDYKASGNNKSTYVRFNSGLNLLGWQLHSDASFSKTNNNPGVWKSNTLYLERGFAQLLGTLRVGDMYTSSDIFDSVRFRGVRLFRDMQMLPNSKQNFTPRVQGIAQSNALVTIEQNGFVVYQKEVPPGPFAITDLQLAGGGADLDVSVKEADGSVTTYLVPYAAVPNMLQPGVSKYDLAAGRSHIEGASKQSDFVQAGYQYGFNNLLTLYGVATLSNASSSTRGSAAVQFLLCLLGGKSWDACVNSYRNALAQNAGVYSFNLTLSYNPITTTCKPDDLLITLDSIPVSQLPATGNKATINSKQGDIILRCKNLLGQQNQTSRKMQVYLSSSDLLTNSNTILKDAEDNGVGFILESNGSPVTLLNITNSSKGYTNLKEVAAKSKLTDTTVSIPITASYYVYDTNKVKSGALEATALINVKYD